MDSQSVISSIGFKPKWVATIINARNVGGVWQYFVDSQFIPVNEIAKPYKLDHLSDSDAQHVLHGSMAVNLLQAYNGINLGLATLAISSGSFTKHFFLTDQEIADAATTTSDVNDGDSLLVLVPTNISAE